MIGIKRFVLILLAMMLSVLCFLASCGDGNEDSSHTQTVSDQASSESLENSDMSQTVSEDEPSVDPAPDFVPEYPMVFSKVTDSLYKVESTLSDGSKLTLTFSEKAWGTYNLGAWRLVTPDNRTLSFVAGATDWEYVYRAGRDASGWVWSGGNHGNENLVMLRFYDGQTNEEIILTAGESVELDTLSIVENTSLHWGDTQDTYCDVKRTYTVAGPQIKLNVDYDYTQNCYFWLSYTCMFPISKKWGLYCDMIDADGKLIRTIETLKVGAADYSGNMNNGNSATRAIVYGYEDTQYKFDVRVNTVRESLDNLSNSFKTAFWDMNTTDNKLYFSKYDQNTPTLVNKGTKLSTECVWAIVIEDIQE